MVCRTLKAFHQACLAAPGGTGIAAPTTFTGPSQAAMGCKHAFGANGPGSYNDPNPQLVCFESSSS